MCGTWIKSSSTVQHTPKITNGGSQTTVDGELTLDTHIYPSTNLADPAFVVYNVTAGPAALFPVQLIAYADIGSVPGELDANDIFIGANTENSLSDGPFKSFLPSQTNDVLVVAQTASGCFDQVVFVRNTISQLSTLPLQLKMFTAKMSGGKGVLEWVVSSNEEGRLFEIQHSEDGKNFTALAVVPASTDKGEEYYTYSDATAASQYYRIKIISRDNSQKYSPIVFIQNREIETDKLTLLQNPAYSTLSFAYQAGEAGVYTIAVYNALGIRVSTVQHALQKGINRVTMKMDQQISRGVYVLEVAGKTTRTIERFVKQ